MAEALAGLSSGPFDFAVAEGEDAATVSFSGELDYLASLAIGPQLEKIAHEAKTDILLDLEEVTLIDSEGIKMLLSAADSARAQNRRVQMIRWSKHVDRILRLAGVRDVLVSGFSSSDPDSQNRIPWRW